MGRQEFSKLSPLGQTAWAIYALESGIYRLDPREEEWTFLFQMLWSFDRIAHLSYREELLLSVVPECLLETPYRLEEYVVPPSAYCYSRDDFYLYSGDEWRGLSGTALTDRLPPNEFGYLHPKLEQKSFLGISQQTYDRLYALYRRCPAQCLEMADRVLLAVFDFILEVLEGERGAEEDLYQAVSFLPLPPAGPFFLYRPNPWDQLFFLGKPCSRQELAVPHLFV